MQPLAVQFIAFVHGLALQKMAELSSIATLSVLGGFAVVFALEVAVMGWAKSSLRHFTRRSRSALADLFYFGGSILGYQTILVLVWTLGLVIVAHRSIDAIHGDLLARIDNPVLGVVLAVVSADFVAYWAHRARHGFAFWWEAHKVHHAAERLNVITSARSHPLDVAWLGLVNALSAAILGSPHANPKVFIALNAVLAVHAGLTHSMLPWSWGRFGRYVLFSPMGHRTHHSTNPEHHDRNFGTLFPIWDWMFGTMYKGAAMPDEVGLPAEGHNRRGIFADMIVVTRRSARAAFASLRGERSYPPQRVAQPPA